MSGVSIFMYHQVGRFAPMTSHRANYCDAGRFARQMAWLQATRASVLSMSQALTVLRGERPLPPRAVVLSFDDGVANFAEYALPVLRQHGFPAIVYVIAGLVGGRGEWLAAKGHPAPDLMSWNTLLALPPDQIEIGSHGLSHTPLAGQPAAVLRTELCDSRRLLEDRLGRPVPHFCYPYGSIDAAAMEMAAAAGYQSAVTCQRGAATADFDPLGLPRKAISYGDTLPGFIWKLYAKNTPKGDTPRRHAR